MPVIAKSTLDHILTIQLNLAWAGEWDCEPARRAWWKVNLSEPANGGDFLRNLAPRTWRWSSLLALREAARRADEARAGTTKLGDRFSSIFRIAPLVDEKLDERLRDLRQGAKDPHTALPGLLFKLTDNDEDSAFDEDNFQEWIDGLGTGTSKVTPTGLRLVGDVPTDPLLRIQKLTHLLADHREPTWPFPYAEVS